MDNFKAIYKMLSALERAMDLPAFSVESFGLDSMQVSGERLYRYLEMLQDAGLIKGAELYSDVTGEMDLMDESRIRITLSGLEYLQKNAVMKRGYNARKGDYRPNSVRNAV